MKDEIKRIAEKHFYPMTFKKDKIGGALADAFNAGYEGKKGGIYRFSKTSAGYAYYQAGKLRKKKD